MIEKIIKTESYLSKSRLPDSDYVVNPYVGCLHGCKYCYACFMKRFTAHQEPWGEFVDVKTCEKPINLKLIQGKSLFLSSVTDCYQPLEKKYRVTRGILQQLIPADCAVTVGTKSALILQDLDVLKQLKNLTVSISVNTLDENFKRDMDNASSIKDRLSALKVLHEEGIKTILFMSPIFPGITDYKTIIEASRGCADMYWFENLNLRGSYKSAVLSYIKEKYPSLYPLYADIYLKKDKTYWAVLAQEIDEYCLKEKLNFKNYFYHEQIRKP